MFDRIPQEMRQYRSWLVWKYQDRGTGKPTKVPYCPTSNRMASVKDPATWGTYDEALSALKAGTFNGLGFVLSDADPYTFIDLDDCKGDASMIATQERIFKEFDSYAEVSPSGTGLHIIVKGAVKRGVRRGTIEVYSSERYMTMTGNVFHDTGIHDRQGLVDTLWAEMAKPIDSGEVFQGLPNESLSDDAILEMANNAVNAEKFRALYYEANWQKYYPSQSEADFALMNIIGFYSGNAIQTKRMFLNSHLGARQASRADYKINRILAQCFDRQLPPIDFSGLRDQLNRAIAAPVMLPPVPVIVPTEESMPKLPVTSTFPRPPGLIGDIADYIYSQATRPVPEISVAAAIGLMAGICGKAYNVSNTGLNQYVMIISMTGTGKEQAAGGIGKLLNEVKKNVPAVGDFLGPRTIASEQAMIKHLNGSSLSFVSIFGEFGLTLQQISSGGTNHVMIGLQKMFLDLYNKSGATDEVQAMIYSDKNNNTAVIKAPAFSVLAESSPEKFYEALDESMISSGLIPRFLVMENKGDRVKRNKGAALVKPSHDLVQAMSNLSANALTLNHSKKVIAVAMDDEATKMFDEFDEHCDRNIVGSKEVRRELWNRAHLKAIKLAALAAVGVNFYEPTVNRQCAEWALDIVLRDVRALNSRFEAGEVGVDNEELKQIVKCVEAFKEYIARPYSELSGYEISQQLHSERVVPYGFIQKRLFQTAPFRKDRLGPTNAIKRVLSTLVQRGDIVEVDKLTMSKKYSSTATCYMVKNGKTFGF